MARVITDKEQIGLFYSDKGLTFEMPAKMILHCVKHTHINFQLTIHYFTCYANADQH